MELIIEVFMIEIIIGLHQQVKFTILMVEKRHLK